MYTPLCTPLGILRYLYSVICRCSRGRRRSTTLALAVNTPYYIRILSVARMLILTHLHPNHNPDP